MRKLFGTDGIRGKANLAPMDAYTAFRVGAAVGHYFRGQSREPKVLIGRDTRLSGHMLEGALTAGLCSVGAEALTLGVITTPGVAYLTRTLQADAGVVISASHNPYVDNGIKIFSKDGFKLPDETEEEIEQLILNGEVSDLAVAPHEVGIARPSSDVRDLYLRHLIDSVKERRFNGMRVVIDCANGAAHEIAPELFSHLEIALTRIGVEPDGRNINQSVGALHPEAIQELVPQSGAQIGVAFDGDADRAIFVDRNGKVVDGDQIMAICAKHLKGKSLLAKDTLVATHMSNLGLELAMAKIGVQLVKTDVGDRYVVEEMRRSGYVFGGEQSGHIIFLDHSTTGDGLLTALKVLSVMAETGLPLDELASIMAQYPQVLKNLMVTYKRPLDELTHSQGVIEDIKKKLGREGRVFVRYSGTENKIRVMVEGKDREEIEKHADEIIRALDADLN